MLLVFQACRSAPGTARQAAPVAQPAESPPTSLAPVVIAEGLWVRSIAPSAWVVTQEFAHNANTLVVRMSDGTVVFCSSPFDSNTTRVLVSWVQKTLQPTRMMAINTHWHLDGTGGNAAYHEAGVTTLASKQTVALATARGERLRDSAAEDLAADLAASVRATPIVPAIQTFDEAQGITLTLGDQRVAVVYPGAAHSQDNVVVYFPRQQLLFGGCALKVGNSIGYLGDASLATWETALGVMRGFGARVVVPGHGETGGPEIIENTLRLVREAQSAARKP